MVVNQQVAKLVQRTLDLSRILITRNTRYFFSILLPIGARQCRKEIKPSACLSRHALWPGVQALSLSRAILSKKKSPVVRGQIRQTKISASVGIPVFTRYGSQSEFSPHAHSLKTRITLKILRVVVRPKIENSTWQKSCPKNNVWQANFAYYHARGKKPESFCASAAFQHSIPENWNLCVHLIIRGRRHIIAA